MVHERSWLAFARALQRDAAARDALTATLRSSPFRAFFWECAPVRRDGPVRQVVLDSPALAEVRAQPGPFRTHLADGAGRPEVRAFDSLGGDARLIAPCETPGTDAAHLATFLRTAPPAQIGALWTAVGREVESWLSTRDDALWISTSGLGVYWLHVRLDTVPKYYTHRPFRSPP